MSSANPTGPAPLPAPNARAARRLCGLAMIVAAVASPIAAHAQLSAGGGPGGGPGAKAPAPEAEKKLAPPPAIPGAVAANGAAPATRPASEMDPNAALFDAIDRGDLAAARDALNRGADLNARNVLGQRPVDMSIDLSRNDITFLLLSLRAQNGDQAPAATGPEDDSGTGDAPAPPVRTASDGHRARGRRATPVAAAAPAVTADVTGAAPSSDPGFLGFNGR